eukprot:765942-Hanusia_phi.AAC.2
MSLPDVGRFVPGRVSPHRPFGDVLLQQQALANQISLRLTSTLGGTVQTEMVPLKANQAGGSSALALAIGISVALACTASVVGAVVYRSMAVRSPLKVERLRLFDPS